MKRLSPLIAVAGWVLSVTVVLATPGSGASPLTLADAVFDPIATSQAAGLESVIQEITIAPGGTAHTGWHTHPGGTVILVESGTFTMNHADCSTTTVAAGRGIVEPGGQVQIARNTSATEPLVLTVVYLDVASPDGPVRADAAAPACAAGAGLPTTATGTGVTAAIIDRATFAGAAAITGVDERRAVVQSLTFAPGGHSGWHSHPGAVQIFVVSGTFSFYMGSDCVRQNFTAGQGITEPGGMIQLARNESTTEPLVLFVVYYDVPLTPAGAFRTDEAEPANCTGLAPLPATPAPAPTALPNTSAVGTAETGASIAVVIALSAAAFIGGLSVLTWRRRAG